MALTCKLKGEVTMKTKKEVKTRKPKHMHHWYITVGYDPAWERDNPFPVVKCMHCKKEMDVDEAEALLNAHLVNNPNDA